MITVLMIVQLFVTLALIGVVLIQRSEGGGLGIGSSQGMGAFMSGRGTANLLTRTTAILAAIFFALSLTMAVLNRGSSGAGRSILDVPAAPASAPPPVVPASPVVPGATQSLPAAPSTTAAPAAPAPNTTAPPPSTTAPTTTAPAAVAPAAPATAPAPSSSTDSGPAVPTSPPAPANIAPPVRLTPGTATPAAPTQ